MLFFAGDDEARKRWFFITEIYDNIRCRFFGEICHSATCPYTRLEWCSLRMLVLFDAFGLGYGCKLPLLIEKVFFEY